MLDQSESAAQHSSDLSRYKHTVKRPEEEKHLNRYKSAAKLKKEQPLISHFSKWEVKSREREEAKKKYEWMKNA